MDSIGQLFLSPERVGLLVALAGLCLVALSGIRWLIESYLDTRGSSTKLRRCVDWISQFGTKTNRGTGTSKTRGASSIFEIALLVFSCVTILTVPASIALAKYFSRYPVYEIGDDNHLVEVLNYDAISGKFEFRYKAIDFWQKLCEPPPFVPGDFLRLYKYEDRGACASLSGEWTAVLIRRDEHGRTDSEVRDERKR